LFGGIAHDGLADTGKCRQQNELEEGVLVGNPIIEGQDICDATSASSNSASPLPFVL
jgi:hypothetical protein